MLGKNLRILGALVMGSTLAFTACGGGDDDGDTGGNGNGGTGGTGAETNPGCDESNCTLPPEKAADQVAPSGDAKTFAVSKIFLGDTDRDGNLSPTAWQKFGYNLDGLISNKNGSNHCKPQPGGNPAEIQTDGPGGIDNAFGASLLGLITSVASDASASLNDSLTEGSFTLLLHNESLGTEANQGPIKAALYAGKDLPAPPVFDGTDEWPIAPELLNNGDINSPKVVFNDAFVKDGIWVSGSGNGSVTLSLAIQGYELNLVINKAVITADISDPNNVVDGVIAGVLDAQSLVEELRKIAGGLDESLCEGDVFEGIANRIRGAADLMKDGTNGDPAKTCDGISIALGFEAKPALLGPVADPSEPGEDACAAVAQ